MSKINPRDILIHFGKYKDTPIRECTDIQFLTWYYQTYHIELSEVTIKLLKTEIGRLVTLEAGRKKPTLKNTKNKKILYLSTKLGFGKYKDRLVNDIIKYDLSYFKWLISVWEGEIDWKVQDIVKRMS